jgi:hypothetical protein
MAKNMKEVDFSTNTLFWGVGLSGLVTYKQIDVRTITPITTWVRGSKFPHS